jgi:STE24 endopeptidase
MDLTIQVLIYGLVVAAFAYDIWLSMLNYRHRNKPIPSVVSDVYDQDAYQKWLSYSMENFRFSMIVKSVRLIVFLLLLSLGAFLWFQDVAEAWFANARLQVLVFLGLYMVVSFVIGLFTSYYATFVIEEKYGFNKTTLKTFVLDKIKSLILTIVLGGGLVYLVVVINDRAGDLFFLFTWLALVAIVVTVNLLYVPLFVPLFNKLTPLEDGGLKEAIHAFAEGVGYEVNKISVMDASRRSSKLNAFFAGLGKTKNVVLYDTLIDKMSTEQIVAVLAHEIGHAKHKHIYFNLGQSVLTLLLYIGVFALVLRTDLFSTAFGFSSANFGFSLILFTILLEPIGILIGLLTSTLSRRHEFQADAYASNQYDPDSMIQALKVLAKENFANLTPHPLYVKLTYSHPPIATRIEAILAGAKR